MIHFLRDMKRFNPLLPTGHDSDLDSGCRLFNTKVEAFAAWTKQFLAVIIDFDRMLSKDPVSDSFCISL